MPQFLQRKFNISGQQMMILFVNILIICVFGFIFPRDTYELYIGYSLAIGAIIIGFLFLNRRFTFSSFVLWGLTCWSLLHYLGGSIDLFNSRLYDFILIPITADVLRFDQIVHFLGYAIVALVLYEIINTTVVSRSHNTLLFMVIIAAIGIGAINEMVEFFSTYIFAAAIIGDNLNTNLDLAADTLGAITAGIYLHVKQHKPRL